jgi:hypothetical protein
VKRPGTVHKSRLARKAKKKAPATRRPTKPHGRTSRRGLGTDIVSLFRKIGLRPEEEIQEFRGIYLEPMTFEDNKNLPRKP